MCITAFMDGSNVDYIMTSTGSQNVGWMAIGWGKHMADTDMVIAWENSDKSITLSQRRGQGHDNPVVVDSPSYKATLLQTLSTTSGSQKSYAFSIPSVITGKTSMIYAIGDLNPNSSSVNADIPQHNHFGVFTVDMSLTTEVPFPGQIPLTKPLTGLEKTFIAHGAIIATGFMILLPIGALVPRLLRTFTSWWYPTHMTLEWFVAGPVILIGFILGCVAYAKNGGGPIDGHGIWGIILFAVYVVQLGIGSLIYWVKPKVLRRRPVQNYIHAIVGLFMIGLAFYQVRDGITSEFPRVASREISKPAMVAWYVLMALIVILYIGGLCLLPRQYRQERLHELEKREMDRARGTNGNSRFNEEITA
ncbi:hypothetical protein DL96DRAFT_1643983 [Flagelloscypha sp. PMI_526]|nr:hypothetical protein DL96DRAFT_1643983 [Flagelloscypha sp. PMI_526]